MLIWSIHTLYLSATASERLPLTEDQVTDKNCKTTNKLDLLTKNRSDIQLKLLKLSFNFYSIGSQNRYISHFLKCNFF